MNYYKHERELDEKLRKMRQEALERYAILCLAEGFDRKPTIQSLHSIIGMHNTNFVDSIRLKFETPKDFIAKWMKGLKEKLGDKEYYNPKTKLYYKPLLIEIMRDEFLRNYTFLFLERNFYRNYKPRTRVKPNENLWKLWFGDNKFKWGLIIAPAYRENEWTNDVSEVRRVTYNYWTIGHILAEGIIDPDSSIKITFNNIDQFYSFYGSVLKRISNSKYEKIIYDKYVNYLQKSKNVLEEPFLIPEIRYAGLDDEHKYRVDFSVLNIYTERFVGFELSPHSTHMAISGIRSKAKSQKDINEELKLKWQNEMEKRNKYFDEFGITVKTYTDAQLISLDSCFNEISKVLSERNENKISFEEELKFFIN